MLRRTMISAIGGAPAVLATMSGTTARADGTGPQLASYYDRHMALVDGVAHGWTGRDQPQRLRDGVRQVGVGEHSYHALLDDGRLLRWGDGPGGVPGPVTMLMTGVSAFACGRSGWFAIDSAGVLWHDGGSEAGGQAQAQAQPPVQRIADDVVDACIGDGADYYIRRDGTLWVRGLAHRGQYGDGRLCASTGYVTTAADALAVRAHTGHAIYLSRDGVVMGTGGNRFGPLGAHGLGDKADRWGRVFDGARAIATGSRHSLAIRADCTLWAWGEGFGIEPRRLLDGVVAAAAGNTATLALRADGSLVAWDGSSGPHLLRLA
jgi:alpha-tubulin suppressor-like RCC1 family protein